MVTVLLKKPFPFLALQTQVIPGIQLEREKIEVSYPHWLTIPYYSNCLVKTLENICLMWTATIHYLGF